MAIGGDHNKLMRLADEAVVCWRGRDWNRVADILERWKPVPGRNVEAQVTASGTILHAQPGGEVTACGFKTASKSGTTWTLRGGSITAGPDTHSVPDFTITFNPQVDESDLLWIEVSLVAVVEDGVLLPGIESSSGAQIMRGASYPSATLPTAASPAGTAIIPLGQWSLASGSINWRADGPCSPVLVSHCLGQLSFQAMGSVEPYDPFFF